MRLVLCNLKRILQILETFPMKFDNFNYHEILPSLLKATRLKAAFFEATPRWGLKEVL